MGLEIPSEANVFVLLIAMTVQIAMMILFIKFVLWFCFYGMLLLSDTKIYHHHFFINHLLYELWYFRIKRVKRFNKASGY